MLLERWSAAVVETLLGSIMCVCVRVVRNGVVVADYMDFNGWRGREDEGMRLGRRDGLAFALSIACT